MTGSKTPPLDSLPTEFFEAIYAHDPDPWGFAKFEYERDKYAATLAALPLPRYRAGLEVGCSIGVLTRLLATRCDRLIAVDAAEAPLPAARARNADAPWVDIRRARMPEDWPHEQFDLIVLSEVLYYFSRADLAVLAGRVRQSLRPGGDLVLVHWLPVAEPPYPLTGDEAVATFLHALEGAVAPISAARETLYRRDVLRRLRL